MTTFSMKTVCRLTDLTPDTLRAWERRYQAIIPKRADSGRRVYDDREVQRLKHLAWLVQSGHSIGQIARCSDDELVMMVSHLKLQQTKRATSSHATHGIAELITAIDRFELTPFKQGLIRIRHQMSPRDFAFDLVPELMFLIGERIEKNEMSISQEHAVTEIIRSHLQSIYRDLEPLDGTGVKAKTLVFATRESDLHDFGLLLAAITCRLNGMKTHYLGVNLPSADLAEAAKRLRAHAVILGISAIPSPLEKISPNDYLSQLDALLPKNTSIWVGGSAVYQLKRISTSREIGVFEKIESFEKSFFNSAS